ncbi:MAG TPA: SGNH/GDSL hydrolase family protein [Chitinophagaceae bacterium]|nr:SGNH/GDSL hydrolase family protein [Chitinophagaceae bacterium]
MSYFFKAIWILLIIFVQLSCTKKTTTSSIRPSPTPVDTITTPVTGSSKTYLALGDSYTIGASVDSSQRFPVQTKEWLLSNGIKMGTPQIIATSGWTTVNLETAISIQNPVGPYDAISLLIGVNDQYQRRDSTGYRDRFANLLRKAIQLTGNKPSHVFVLSIPDYSVTPFARYNDMVAIRKEIDEFNLINKEVTLQHNCAYLDITTSTREAANDPSLIAGDGLHPSGKEYKKWAERLGLLMKVVLQ